jgi:hypothetical protein
MQVAVVLYRQQKNNNPRRKSIFTWRERGVVELVLNERSGERWVCLRSRGLQWRWGTLVVVALVVCLLACLHAAGEAIRRGSEAIILTLLVNWSDIDCQLALI